VTTKELLLLLHQFILLSLILLTFIAVCCGNMMVIDAYRDKRQ